MPSPKSGTAGNLVPPAAPDEAKDADEADPGQVEQVKAGQRETQTGKYGSQPVKPFKAEELTGAEGTPGTEESGKKSWIEVILKDEDNKPVPGARYRITMPDESVKDGTLDEKGKARVEGIDPGNCKITFPELHPDIWSPA